MFLEGDGKAMLRASWHRERVDVLCFGSCRFTHKFCQAIDLEVKRWDYIFLTQSYALSECPRDFNTGAFLRLNALNAAQPSNLSFL